MDVVLSTEAKTMDILKQCFSDHLTALSGVYMFATVADPFWCFDCRHAVDRSSKELDVNLCLTKEHTNTRQQQKQQQQ